MRIVAQTNLKVKDLVNGYLNDTATGAVEAYNGRLNVRPAYQREFVWDKGSTVGGKKQEALIDSIMKGYPINVMYWVKIGHNQAGEDKSQLLSRRAFTDKDKKAQYDRQRGVCPHCLKRYEYVAMAGDHIIPYKPIPASGQVNGTTTPDNLQMLCHSCNLDKLNKPFDKASEEKRLQDLYAMSDDEIASLPEGGKN